MTGKPLLHRIQDGRTRETRYQIVGFEHLVVEAQYSDGNFGRPQLLARGADAFKLTDIDLRADNAEQAG